ncbi:MAG: peroxiredoxin [Chitinivibrionales bacterium]|nr:peroxiredoxin [Chitinivibrionales bacterium]
MAQSAALRTCRRRTDGMIRSRPVHLSHSPPGRHQHLHTIDHMEEAMKPSLRYIVLVSIFALSVADGALASSVPTAAFPYEFRTIDAYGNNLRHPKLGTPYEMLLRLTNPAYADGYDAPSGPYRPNPRAISNAVHAQGDTSIPNTAGITDIFWVWGQFVDHDIGLTEPEEPHEPFPIPVPPGDPFFDPLGTGDVIIPLNRSLYEYDRRGVRQQLNEITAYIDASQVYGSELERAYALRTLDGTGKLKTSKGNLLPFNTDGLPNWGPREMQGERSRRDNGAPWMFIAGDIRVNENVALTAMHTLFMREHNYWCDLLARVGGYLDGDLIYELARAIVAAEIQSITYNEFLPLLLGPNALPPYKGYCPEVNPQVANEFSVAAYRFGHSMLSNSLLLLDPCGKPVAGGSLELRNAFMNPQFIVQYGIEPLLRGAVQQVAQKTDVYVVDGIRNFLFGAPGMGGSDLASLNLQRGRDHGLANYNRIRAQLGLGAVSDFSEISSDPVVRARLESRFASVNEIDLWTGGLAEDLVPGAQCGRTIHTIVSNQFRRLRDGDRFWYKTYLPPLMVWLVERRTLADIIRHNSDLAFWEVPRSAFLVEPLRPAPKGHDAMARRIMDAECYAAARELVDYYAKGKW